jgi:two-component system, LuxR family, response regulator FixJ
MITKFVGIDMTNPENILEDSSSNPLNCHKKNIIYIVDDDSDVRKSLYFRLSAYFINIRPFATASDFLEQLPFLVPAPILLDIRMANIDGLQLLEILKERAVHWPVVILTAHGDVGVAVRAMKLGAIEFLEKPFAPEALDQAIALAFAVLDQSEHVFSIREQARCRIKQLTARESDTMAILMEGVHNKEVAHRLGLSVRTVEMHRGNALAKLNVKSIAEVVQLVNIAELMPNLKLKLYKSGDDENSER